LAKNLCREVPIHLVPVIGVGTGILGFSLANHHDYPPGQLTVALYCLRTDGGMGGLEDSGGPHEMSLFFRIPRRNIFSPFRFHFIPFLKVFILAFSSEKKQRRAKNDDGQ